MRLQIFALTALLLAAPAAPLAVSPCVQADRRWEAWTQPRVKGGSSVGWPRWVRPWDGKLCTRDDVREAEARGHVVDARRMAAALDKRDRRARRRGAR